jgi:hypothetical protein
MSVDTTLPAVPPAQEIAMGAVSSARPSVETTFGVEEALQEGCWPKALKARKVNKTENE